MTSDGVDGTAADGQPGAGPRSQVPRRLFIKHDDGRLVPRYMGPAYPHTPAGAAPNSLRRERQVASALRNNPDFVIANLICGADGTAGRACGGLRLRVRPGVRVRLAATRAARAVGGGQLLERPPRCPAKGSR